MSGLETTCYCCCWINSKGAEYVPFRTFSHASIEPNLRKNLDRKKKGVMRKHAEEVNTWGEDIVSRFLCGILCRIHLEPVSKQVHIIPPLSWAHSLICGKVVCKINLVKAFHNYIAWPALLPWWLLKSTREGMWSCYGGLSWEGRWDISHLKKKNMHYTRFNYEVGYVTLSCGKYGSILIFLLKFLSFLLYQCLINLFIFLSSAQGLKVGCYYRPVWDLWRCSFRVQGIVYVNFFSFCTFTYLLFMILPSQCDSSLELNLLIR